MFSIAQRKEANEVMQNAKTRWMFKIWLVLYQLENFLWHRYSASFMSINGGKDFHEYHQNQTNTDDIPF
jgi:hypothetical protein